jgi:hypothetical protein
MSRTFPQAGRMGSLCTYLAPSETLYSHPPTEFCCRCALIHCHRPDLLDYDKLDKVRCSSVIRISFLIAFLQANRHENTRLAFQVAAEHLGIPVRSLRDMGELRLIVTTATL